MTLRGPIQPGVYSGIITVRSSEVAGVGHTYTVWLDAIQIQFEGVAPQNDLRWTTISDQIDLIPFPIGTRVSVHIFNAGDGFEALIETSELPDIGPCT
jgi:hypothetical protein